MTNYREILRLRSLGLNHSQIAKSMADWNRCRFFRADMAAHFYDID